MTTNLVSCSRCNPSMIDEEYDNHKCMPNPRGLRKIKIAYHFMTFDDKNRKVIEAKGLDGITYQLVEIPEDKEHTKIPYQPMGNREKNNQQGNSTQNDHIFKQLSRVLCLNS